SLKIVLADGFLSGLPAFHVRPSGNNDVRPVEFQRRLFIAFRGGEYTRDCLHAVENLAGYRIFPSPDFYNGSRIAPTEIVGVSPIEFEVEKILRIETEIHARENKETAHQEASANKKY